MDPTLANFISLGIGALITWFGIFLSNKYLIRNQREQWDREHKAEQEKWLREKLQEIYSNCIYFLGKTPQIALNYALPSRLEYGTIRDASGLETEKLRVEYERLGIEFKQMHFNLNKLNFDFENEKRRWLNLLAVYHPFRDSPEFNDFVTKIREDKLTVVDITELSARDPRLNSEKGKLNK